MDSRVVFNFHKLCYSLHPVKVKANISAKSVQHFTKSSTQGQLSSAIMSDSAGNTDKGDVFMKKFKDLKRRKPPPDLSSVLDVDTELDISDKVSQISPLDAHGMTHRGLVPADEWRIYELISVPGALFIRNPFTPAFRRHLIARSLADYPLKPHITNLDATGRTYSDIWRSSCDLEDDAARRELRKLRWTTLGYHYDWTKKIYRKDLMNEFPPDLSCVSQLIIDTVLGRQVCFKPEAAIVNYYHLDSSLSGHTDHSEFDLTAPLISISFGLPCVFMIGGHTKSQEPEALFLRDGDIVIMSGVARMSYHAVPRVLPYEKLTGSRTPLTTWTIPKCETDKQNSDCTAGNEPASQANHACTLSLSDTADNVAVKRHLSTNASISKTEVKRAKSKCDNVHLTDLINSIDNDLWKPFEGYLETSRININIRQMFEPGKDAEDYEWPSVDTFCPPAS